MKKIFVIFLLVLFVLILLTCSSPTKRIFHVNKKGTEIFFDQDSLTYFIKTIEHFKSDSSKNIFNIDLSQNASFSPIPWLSFIVSTKDSIRLLLYSIESNEIIKYDNLLNEGVYFIDFHKTELPKGNYIIKDQSSTDTSMMAFWLIGN